MSTDVLRDERKPGWYLIDNEIIDIYGARMGPYGIAVYNVIARYADKNGNGAFPSYQTIADKVGIGRAKAVQTVTLLINLGLLRKTQRMDVAGDSTSNQYTLVDVKAIQNPGGVVSNEYHLVSNEYHPGIPPIPQVVSHVDTKKTNIKEDKVKERDARAETQELTAPQPAPQPKASLSFSKQKENEYMPGVPDPRKQNTQRTQVAEYVKEAKDLGLTAAQLTANTDVLLSGFGKKALADAGDNETLNYAKELALMLSRMDGRFKTTEGLQSVFQSWEANDYRGDTPPTSKQYKEHASLMLAGKVVCTRKKPDTPPAETKPPVLPFKKWCLLTHKTDMPQFVPNLSESMIHEQYEQYKRQYQQAH